MGKVLPDRNILHTMRELTERNITIQYHISETKVDGYTTEITYPKNDKYHYSITVTNKKKLAGQPSSGNRRIWNSLDLCDRRSASLLCDSNGIQKEEEQKKAG